LLAAIRKARTETGNGDGKVIYLSPQGKTLNQQKVVELAQRQSLILVCGRYQGIDARVLDAEIDEEVSLGDFILSGGEIAAMALIDAMIRFQPGALGADESAQQDSFADGLLHCPQYTRPQSFAGQDVPPVLLSGDHAAIRRWRLQQSLGMTWLKRPDLLAQQTLDAEQTVLLEQFKDEHGN
jgi:tRNA (guanine37-N1)-methyltransferase